MAEADITQDGVVRADGTAELRFTPRRQSWVVKQVSPYAPTIGPSATGALFLDRKFICPFVAQQTAIGGDPPVPVRFGQTLRVTWAGGIPGTPVSATLLYDDGTGP